MVIALIIIGILLIVLMIFVVTNDKLLQLFGCLVGVYAISIEVNILSLEYAYKESLKGNNIYKMEIKYEMKDSVYVPSDTVFVLIKK